MDPPGNADADDVEREHGHSVNAHGAGIGAGADDGSHDEDGEDGVADVLPKEFGADDSE